MCSITDCLCGESCPQKRACSGHRVKTRRCLHKGCGKRFVPKCGAQVFCSEECRKAAGFDNPALLKKIVEYLAAAKDRRKQQVKRAKRTFYRTEKGRLAKSAENKRYYARKRERQIAEKSAKQESINGQSVLCGL